MTRRVDHVDDAIRVEYIADEGLADEGLADRLRRSMLRPFTLGLFYSRVSFPSSHCSPSRRMRRPRSPERRS